MNKAHPYYEWTYNQIRFFLESDYGAPFAIFSSMHPIQSHIVRVDRDGTKLVWGKHGKLAQNSLFSKKNLCF